METIVSDAPAPLDLGSVHDTAPVFLCPGQGAQKPGMGASLMGLPEVADAFACASEVFERDIAALVAPCASASGLADTSSAQAATCALTIGVARALMARGCTPCALAGFSLGQASALPLAGMVDDETAFLLVRERARAMEFAVEQQPGAMSALLRADVAEVVALCGRCAGDGVLVPANFNCPGQIVVSGTSDAVARAEEAWTAQGKRFSRLACAGAFHSPLMEPAQEPFAAFLAGIEFAEPVVPVICNTDAALLDARTVRARLVAHLTQPVLFEQSVRALVGAGARSFAEIGHGGVLTGLVKRIDRTLARVSVADRAAFEAFLA